MFLQLDLFLYRSTQDSISQNCGIPQKRRIKGEGYSTGSLSSADYFAFWKWKSKNYHWNTAMRKKFLVKYSVL